MYSTEQVAAFLRRCQKRLDEELDAGSAFWSQTELTEYLNEGLRMIWQVARETHQNWFVRQFASTDPVLRIGGRTYDPAELTLRQGIQRLRLPPDFHELLLFEPILPEDAGHSTGDGLPAVILEYANLTQQIFRQGMFDTVTSGIRRYRYDVVYGPDGPYIFISPTMSIEDTAGTLLAYVAAPLPLTPSDSFEGTGFTDIMVDAALAYVCLAAVRKEDLRENVAAFSAIYAEKLGLVTRSSSPKQTRDGETVNGYLEEELY